MSKDDDERFWNFIIYKFYGTDEELEEALPILGIIALIVIIGLGIFYIL